MSLKEFKKFKNCNHEFMYNILLGTQCWHIIPHPKKVDKLMIIDLLETIANILKNEINE